jgi:hypothetical protein
VWNIKGSILNNITLLDVKNDYLFKRIFGEDEEIFIDYIMIL